jgi:hypothetical protein
MKLGSMVVVVVALGGGLACSHEAKPVAQPDETAPLPPASGTTIGLLVDNAVGLELTDDQIGKLREISDQLGRQLAADDNDLRPDPNASPASDEPQQRGLGVRAGGSRGDGEAGRAGGGAEAFPGAAGGGATARQVYIPASTVNAVYQQRAHHLRDAIRRALGLMLAGQQARAVRLLTDHGVNVDTGEVTGGEPGVAPMAEPKLGQPLPRE